MYFAITKESWGYTFFPLLFQTTQPAVIHLRRQYKNRNMAYANKIKKKPSLVLTLILLSISFLLFLPQVLPKGYFEIKVSVPAVCCA